MPPRRRSAFPCHEGLSLASSGCCSRWSQREGTEACFPGHRKGWKQLNAPSVSPIKKQHMPQACSPRWFFTTGLGCQLICLQPKFSSACLLKAQVCALMHSDSAVLAQEQSGDLHFSSVLQKVLRNLVLGQYFGDHWLEPTFLRLVSLDACLRGPQREFSHFVFLF